jgi:hypothetical protein
MTIFVIFLKLCLFSNEVFVSQSDTLQVHNTKQENDESEKCDFMETFETRSSRKMKHNYSNLRASTKSSSRLRA